MPSLSKSSWLPVELTQSANSVDHLFYIMLGIIAFFFVLVEVLLVAFLIRYRRTKRNQVGVNVHGNNLLETIWTAIPFVILAVMGAYSVHYVYAQQTPPAPDYTIKVTGHEWYWEFQYPNNVVSRQLVIPAGKQILFDIHSADVTHGFYIPEFRIQQDALNDRVTQFSVNVYPKDVGQTFEIPCDQFCGAGHPDMIAHGKVDTDAQFQHWMASQKA